MYAVVKLRIAPDLLRIKKGLVCKIKANGDGIMEMIRLVLYAIQFYNIIVFVQGETNSWKMHSKYDSK